MPMYQIDDNHVPTLPTSVLGKLIKAYIAFGDAYIKTINEELKNVNVKIVRIKDERKD